MSEKGAQNGAAEFQREAEMQKAIENIDATQNALDGLNDHASEEILAIEARFNKQREPLYKKRADILLQIPNFWHRVFLNHPNIMPFISSEGEEECLQHLLNVMVIENEDIKSGYKLQFVFDSQNNPFFSNDLVEKVVTNLPGGVITATCTKIQWKPGKELVGSNASASTSFFSWLVNWPTSVSGATGAGDANGAGAGVDEDMDDVDIGDMIKEDIWPNPLNFYMMSSDDEDDDDDAEGDAEEFDDEDDEDGEGAEGDAGDS